MVFSCDSCGHSVTVQKYSFKAVGGEVVYSDDNKKEIVCDTCCIPMKKEEIKWDGVPAFGKFASMSPSEKQTFLKKRSKMADKKNREYKNHIYSQNE